MYSDSEQTRPGSMKPLYLGVLLTSLSAILFEVALTKIFSVTLWYHFAYLAVSLALFGLGGGGLLAFFGRSFFAPRFPGVLKHLALLQFAAIMICLFLVLYFPPSINLLIRLTIIYIACSVPFVLVGLVVSLILYQHAADTPRIYFADLAGSAAGCIVFVLAINLVSGPFVIVIGALLALVSAIAFTAHDPDRTLLPVIMFAVLMALGLYYVDSATKIFSVKYTKTYEERDDVLFEKWSPLARITVYPTVFWMPDPLNPFGWGMSNRFKPEHPIEQLWIEQDGSAGTPITRFSGDFDEVDYLKYDVTSFAYHVRLNAANAFIIGSGGGRDVLAARSFGIPHVKACDINGVIVGLVKGRYKEFAGDIYNAPGVDVEVAEGRNFIRRQSDQFDIIQISLIDSWAATVAGAFSLAENNLYTVEAFTDYLDRLSEDGLLSVSRYLFKPRNQSLRLAILARRALEERGVSNPERNIVVISTNWDYGVSTTLIKKTPFTKQEIERIQRIAGDLGFPILYIPGFKGDRSFVDAITTESLESYIESRYFDLSPPTDDRPFFFQLVPFSHAFDLVKTRGAIPGQSWNYYAPLVLLVLLGLSSVLVLLFYILPLVISRTVEGLPKLWGLYFVLIGTGFMFVEIPLLQKGSLYLGHPTLSLTVVLFGMLIFAGLGSFWSGRFAQDDLYRMIRIFLIVTITAIGIVSLTSEWLVYRTIGLPLAYRVALYIALIGPGAFFMGTLFPSGIRLVQRSHQSSIPWVWAVNGGSSVMGSVLSMTVAMSSGYGLTLMLGGACYLAALLLVIRR